MSKLRCCIPRSAFRVPRSCFRLICLLLLGLLLSLEMPRAIAAAPEGLVAQGQQALVAGRGEEALVLWQRAERVYGARGDRQGVWGNRLNQARALQALGFYERARQMLTELEAALAQEADTPLKLTVQINLGNLLRLSGDFEGAQRQLQGSLEQARRLDLHPQIEQAMFALAHNLVAQDKDQAALRLYQAVVKMAGPLALAAQVRQLDVLLRLQDYTEAQAQLAALRSRLGQLSEAKSLYTRLELADSWLRLQQATSKAPGVAADPADPAALTALARFLAATAQQAQTGGDRRAQSYALGQLAQVYEQAQRWPEADRLTRQALALAEELTALDIAYRWDWQLGRIYRAQGQTDQALGAYRSAVDRLQTLRYDLVALGTTTQFSFRSEVEPVYREFVDLLLPQGPEQPLSTPQLATRQLATRLQEARQVIESLRLAELTNFFREACLDLRPQAIDQIDPKAAILYSILLDDRLEVIVSIPNQPLTHFTSSVPKATVEATMQQFRNAMRATSFPAERLPAAQQLYQWLLQPIVAELDRQRIQTLVFIADGSLRNIPMAALHDGQHYLIERYRIALAPSLQLFQAASLYRRRPQVSLKALVAGLSETNQGFAALPNVPQEIQALENHAKTTTLVNDQFTPQAFSQAFSTLPYNILHFATHGQFSSQARNTFLLAWGSRLTSLDLQRILARSTRRTGLDLLVLSACQTAQGDDRATLGLAGLAVRSGARSTLATLWAVNDDSTAAFFQQFYSSLLQQGLSRAEALQQAQLTLLQQPQYQHPYYWAPFVLVGSWQ